MYPLRRHKKANTMELEANLEVPRGEFRDVIIGGRTVRVCGPAVVLPTGYVYFFDQRLLMSLDRTSFYSTLFTA